jgi:hypothetical protein
VDNKLADCGLGEVKLVLPAKVFQIQTEDEFTIDSAVQRLKDFHDETSYETVSGETIPLVSEVLELKQEGNIVRGIFSRDFIARRSFRRDIVETPITEEAPFWIIPFEDQYYVIVTAPSGTSSGKKLITNHVANALSAILLQRAWGIVEVELASETLKEMHESNPQASKLIWFDDLDYPSVQKLCLAGSGLADTKLYQEYLAHGKIWYVVFEVQHRGIVVGITRKCVITLFSKSTLEEFVTHIREDVFPLLELTQEPKTQQSTSVLRQERSEEPTAQLERVGL